VTDLADKHRRLCKLTGSVTLGAQFP
jgi:hypothetical protein